MLYMIQKDDDDDDKLYLKGYIYVQVVFSLEIKFSIKNAPVGKMFIIYYSVFVGYY